MVGMTTEDITEDVLAALRTIIAGLLEVPEEDVSVRVVPTADGRRMKARRLQAAAIVEYDVEVPADDANEKVEMLSDGDFDNRLEGEISTYEDSMTLFANLESADTFELPTIITLSPTAAPEPSNEDDGGIFGDIFVLVGIAAGGTVALAALVFVAVKKSRSSSTNESDHFEMGHVKQYKNPMEGLSGSSRADII